MTFQATPLARPIVVDRVVTVHYFEYASSYYFEGERHDFWELLYVDKGEVDVIAEGETHRLPRGALIFHRPGEFHALRATGAVAPNLVVVSFYCQSPHMDFFHSRITATTAAQRALLGRIVTEGERAFSTPLGDPTTTALTRREHPPFGAEQLLGAALEELLILLRRNGDAPLPAPACAAGDSGRAALFDTVRTYLLSRLAQPLTLSQVCTETFIGRSRLQQLFRERTGGGVMEYFGTLRIDAAKSMIREERGNFTEIAILLGYQSIYYFSRHFKKVAGMTPSEYAGSVRVLSAKSKPAL